MTTEEMTNVLTGLGNAVALGNPALPDGGWEQVGRHWRQLAGESWLIGDLYVSLARRFVRSVQIEHPESFRQAAGQGGVLYLANHQNLLESLFFTTVMSALARRPIGTMIKIWIRDHWIGRLLSDAAHYPEFVPDAVFPYRLFYFNDAEPRSIFGLLGEMRSFMLEGGSCMVHVEGTRAYSSKHRVTKISDSVVRLAVDAGVPVIPVRFAGGLPENDVEEKPIYPYRYAAQDIYLGQAILPDTLAELSMKDRKLTVLDAINRTGPRPEAERMNEPQPEFAREVENWSASAECLKEYAVLYQVLRQADPAAYSRDTLDLLAGRGASEWPDTPKGRWLANWAGQLLGERGSRLLRQGKEHANE
ncbi:1-acyl-sn-glycerol-3-phosphate acyltransferase [Cohnella zeiphila]|uniref:1-acyl-sn-glycerol-3-phosphate acyltransferase n=1 Tax=Cohnella zeiphila TaxID=2761120 RepID=A0A7X0SPC5_9BACL|nr:1-acyl-sn-glycerol-3-phosphate acyltransferase [Cohnella zeiphila]